MNFPHKHLASAGADQCEPGQPVLRRVTIDMLLAEVAPSVAPKAVRGIAHCADGCMTADRSGPQQHSDLQHRIHFFAGARASAQAAKPPRGSFSSLQGISLPHWHSSNRSVATGKDVINRDDSANSMKSQIDRSRGKNTNADTA
ncbi:hypothetical protein [Sphingorhabdus sp. Alg239-R122]|uniref:hypothetical protein n=1 Tax=Sphingorhabdus sp. Alg239-R122 TaxID=2305989 RepID=UPI0013DAB4A8|nr:hypothetical protein [Sphingorhabdus sp. Alg239-R122]